MLHVLQPSRRHSIVDEQALVAETEKRLVERYSADGVPPETVRVAVTEAFTRLSEARVRSFLPILVERAVRVRLSEPG